MFGNSLEYRAARKFLKMKKSFCSKNCFFFLTDDCTGNEKDYKECEKRAKERLGVGSSIFKRFYLWVKA